MMKILADKDLSASTVQKTSTVSTSYFNRMNSNTYTKILFILTKKGEFIRNSQHLQQYQPLQMGTLQHTKHIFFEHNAPIKSKGYTLQIKNNML